MTKEQEAIALLRTARWKICERLPGYCDIPGCFFCDIVNEIDTFLSCASAESERKAAGMSVEIAGRSPDPVVKIEL